jgi:HEAT repeat protein
MPLIILIALIIAGLIWWARSERALNYNERLYLKRRGYASDDGHGAGPPVAKDTRLFNLIESLGDLSPFSRQRAAEDLSRMCEAGGRDVRMLPALVAALDDKEASVRSAVAAALGNLGNAEALASLKQRLENEESIHVRSSLQKAIDKLNG